MKHIYNYVYIGFTKTQQMNLRISILIIFAFLLIKQTQADYSVDYKKDSLRVNSMRTIQFSDQIAALEIGFHILDNQSNKDSNLVIAQTLTTIANIWSSQGYYALAEEYYSESMENYIKLKDSVAIAWVYINMGNLNFKNKLFINARYNYKQALIIFKKIKLLDGQATVFNNLALINLETNNIDTALINFTNALKIRQKLNNQGFIAHSYIYLGDAFFRNDKPVVAQEYFHKALTIGMKTDSLNIIGRSCQFLGIIYFKLGQDSLSSYYFQRAENDFIKTEKPKYLFELFIEKARQFQQNEKSKEAKAQLLHALEVAKKHDFIKGQIDIYEELLSFHKEANPANITEQYTWNQALYNLYKSLYKTEVGKSLALMNMRHELIGIKSTIKLQDLQISKSRIIKNTSIIIGLLSLLIFFILITKYKEKQKRTLESNIQIAKNLKQELAIEQLKTEQIKQKSDLDRRELMMKTTFLEQFNNQIRKYSEELNYQISLIKPESSKGLKKLLLSMTNSAKPDDFLKDFEKQFVLVYPGFLEELARKYPNLTAKDLKLCAFHKMNLDTKEIAHITGLTVRAVQTSRYRLRLKLNIPKETQLLAFLNKG